MMYGDPQQQQQQQHQGGEFHRGPPPPTMMRQPSASSTNLAPLEYHHPSGPAPPVPPYDGTPLRFSPSLSLLFRLVTWTVEEERWNSK